MRGREKRAISLAVRVHVREMDVTSDAGDRGSNIIAGGSLVCFRRRKL